MGIRKNYLRLAGSIGNLLVNQNPADQLVAPLFQTQGIPARHKRNRKGS